MANKSLAGDNLLTELPRIAKNGSRIVADGVISSSRRKVNSAHARGFSDSRLPSGTAGRSVSRGRSRSRKPRVPTYEAAPANKERIDHPSSSNTGFAKEANLARNKKVDFSRDPPTTTRVGGGSIFPKSPPAPKASFNVATRSWAAVAKSAAKGYDLTYVPPDVVNNKPVVNISDEILLASDPKWHECLVGYFVGKKLPFKLTESALKHVWGNHLSEVLANDEGFYFFHIPDKEYRRQVLDGGPLTVAKVPLILQQWHPLLELKKGHHASVPIWVRLRNIPYSLWSALGISAVASAIGKPLYVDAQTEQMKMISYARVCIEINAKSALADSIDVQLKGEIRSVAVEYEWKPSFCLKCGTFGHKCAASTTAVPIPPSAPNTDNAVLPQSIQSLDGWQEVGSRRNANKATASGVPGSSEAKQVYTGHVVSAAKPVKAGMDLSLAKHRQIECVSGSIRPSGTTFPASPRPLQDSSLSEANSEAEESSDDEHVPLEDDGVPAGFENSSSVLRVSDSLDTTSGSSIPPAVVAIPPAKARKRGKRNKAGKSKQ